MVVGILVVVVIVGVVFMVQELAKTDKAMAAIEVNPEGISAILESLADGTYKGEFKPSRFVGATVNVNIAAHKIVSIDIIEHNNMRGKPAEVITDKVVASQTLAVDSVSGATASSKVLLIAIENAIRGAK